jgi:hypothetical protein
MSRVLTFFSALLAWMRGSHVSRDAEILFLRQQLLVLRRSAPARLRLRNSDRLIFVWLYRLFLSLLEAPIIFNPEMLVRWHRGGFRLFWRWKSRRPSGRPAVPIGICRLIRQISRENFLWGAPRIHGELLKLGIEISQSVRVQNPGSATSPEAVFSSHAPNQGLQLWRNRTAASLTSPS